MLLLALASLAKRTSVARSGEEAVPGDLKIDGFLRAIAASSSIASSSGTSLA